MGRRQRVEDSPAYRDMYDAADPSGIPRTARMVACYVDGYAWADRAHELFPAAAVVTIAVSADDDADVLDVEPGAASIWQVRGWLKRRITQGLFTPTVYCSRARWYAIRALTVGVRKDWWVADWTGFPHTLRGAVAVQYASNKYFDTSLVADPGWPHRKPSRRRPRPPVTTPPTPPGPDPEPSELRVMDESMREIKQGPHAETAVPMPAGARGIRITTTTTADLLVDFGGKSRPLRVKVEFSTGPADIPLPRDTKRTLVRQARIIRANEDMGADAAVAII